MQFCHLKMSCQGLARHCSQVWIDLATVYAWTRGGERGGGAQRGGDDDDRARGRTMITLKF